MWSHLFHLSQVLSDQLCVLILPASSSWSTCSRRAGCQQQNSHTASALSDLKTGWETETNSQCLSVRQGYVFINHACFVFVFLLYLFLNRERRLWPWNSFWFLLYWYWNDTFQTEQQTKCQWSQDVTIAIIWGCLTLIRLEELIYWSIWGLFKVEKVLSW